MTKELDFWSLLKIINEYDHWLSDRLCSINDDSNPTYNILRECREKLQGLIER